MRDLSLARVGSVCALATAVGFVLGIALMGASGVATLIPKAGEQTLTWISDVQDGGDVFSFGAWLVIFAGLLGLVAFIGFYDTLRDAGPIMILAPVAATVGWTLVTISQVIPVAMASQLAPGYSNATGATRDALAVTADTLATANVLTNYFGEALLWAVAVPLYALAILKTAALPRWIAWLGFLVAAFGGWLGLLAPLWHVADVLNWIAVPAFQLFMASIGIAVLLRRRQLAADSAPALATPGHA